MAIEVLLRRSVDSLGRVGEVVRVKPGYARNYLFPHGIAVLPSKENLRLVEKDKVVEAELEAERAKVRAELLARLSGAQVHIEAKSNPEGHLFGSVGPKQVADALVAKGFKDIEERNVRFEHVKQLGEYEVKVHLSADAETTIKLWVVDEVTKTTSKEAAAPAKDAPAQAIGVPALAKAAPAPAKGAPAKGAPAKGTT